MGKGQPIGFFFVLFVVRIGLCDIGTGQNTADPIG
jgi:hypothetical protein